MVVIKAFAFRSQQEVSVDIVGACIHTCMLLLLLLLLLLKVVVVSLCDQGWAAAVRSSSCSLLSMCVCFFWQAYVRVPLNDPQLVALKRAYGPKTLVNLGRHIKVIEGSHGVFSLQWV